MRQPLAPQSNIVFRTSQYQVYQEKRSYPNPEVLVAQEQADNRRRIFLGLNITHPTSMPHIVMKHGPGRLARPRELLYTA